MMPITRVNRGIKAEATAATRSPASAAGDTRIVGVTLQQKTERTFMGQPASGDGSSGKPRMGLVRGLQPAGGVLAALPGHGPDRRPRSRGNVDARYCSKPRVGCQACPPQLAGNTP